LCQISHSIQSIAPLRMVFSLDKFGFILSFNLLIRPCSAYRYYHSCLFLRPSFFGLLPFFCVRLSFFSASLCVTIYSGIFLEIIKLMYKISVILKNLVLLFFMKRFAILSVTASRESPPDCSATISKVVNWICLAT